MNPLLIAAIAAGALFLFSKAQNVSVLSKSFDYKFAVKNFRFHTATEIRFSLEITILNPSNLGITITNPLIQVFYNGSQIARSDYNVPSMSIMPMAQSVLPRFDFSINLLSNWFTIKNMLAALLKGVTLTNIANAKEIVSKNQAAFFKLLNAQFTGNMNGTPFTKSFPLG